MARERIYHRNVSQPGGKWKGIMIMALQNLVSKDFILLMSSKTSSFRTHKVPKMYLITR
jgi:hypothetical protein